MVFTDYYIEPYEILRGATDAAQIVVRVMGGSTDYLTAIADDLSPDFELGNKYLLFLTLSGGGPFCTEGYYYYLIGGRHGALTVSDSETFISDEEDREFILSELRETVAEINEQEPAPTEEDLIRRSRESWRQNVENGFLIMSEEDLDEELYRRPHRPARIRSNGGRPSRPGRN